MDEPQCEKTGTETYWMKSRGGQFRETKLSKARSLGVEGRIESDWQWVIEVLERQ